MVSRIIGVPFILVCIIAQIMSLQSKRTYFTTQNYVAYPGKIVEHFELAQMPSPHADEYLTSLSNPPQSNVLVKTFLQEITEEPPHAASISLNEYPHTRTVCKYISVHAPPTDMEEEFRKPVIIRPKYQALDNRVDIIVIKVPKLKMKKGILSNNVLEQKSMAYLVFKHPYPEVNIVKRSVHIPLSFKSGVDFAYYKDHRQGYSATRY